MNGGKISVILPVYNEVVILQTVLEKYFADLDSLNRPYEVIAINDGCCDGSEDVLLSIAKTYRNLRVVNMDGRYGKQASITAGMEIADEKSDIVVLVDVDILNPVGAISQAIARIDSGENIVLGVRENFGFDRVKAFFSDLTVRVGAFCFGISGYYTGKANVAAYSRSVVDVILTLPERNKYMRTMDTWTGWSVDYFIYANCYNNIEAKNILAEAKQKAAVLPKIRGHKPLNRDRCREHSGAMSAVYLMLFSALATLVCGLCFTLALPNAEPLFQLLIWASFVILLGAALMFYIRAVLVKRIGVIYPRTSKIYEIKNVVN